MDSVAELAARSDALDVLGDVLAWELTPERWAEVEQVVTELAAALASHDVAAIRRGTSWLERFTPLRAVSKIETAQAAADSLRFRVNHMIHDLDDKADSQDGQRKRGG